MKYEKVIIKQIPDDTNATASGLHKYKRSRFPSCADTFQPALMEDGRYITGIDPSGVDLSLIKDPDLREEQIKEREQISQTLKRTLPNSDFSPTSTFWESFFVKISTDQDLILNRLNPYDVLKYHLLVSNGYVAPSLDDVGNPFYRDAKYYCHVEEVEEREKISTQKLRDRAKGELVKIMEDKDRMLLIGKFLEGTKYKDRMLPDTLYGNLSDFIENRANPENVEKFIKAMKMSVEDLQYKVTVDTAIRKHIIRFKDGHYTRGGVNFGRNAMEVLHNLKQPELAIEFAQIYEEVNDK